MMDFDALLDYGFKLLNHADSDGQHALMYVAYRHCKPDLVQKAP